MAILRKGALLLLCLCGGIAVVSAQTDPNDDIISKWENIEKYVSPFFDPPSWQPVSVLNYAVYGVQAKVADWASVVSACKAVGKQEKRMYNMFIRIAFHDAFAVDLKGCVGGNKENHDNCPGADSSAVLDINEIIRPENGHDGLGNMTAKAILKIASFYGVSAADALAVCSTVAIEQLSGGRIKIIGGGDNGFEKNFRVGRLDFVPGESQPAPEHTLPHGEINVKEFAEFWKKNNMTIDDGVALIGSHSNLELQGCRINSKKEGGECDIDADEDLKGECKDLRVFHWDNHYYHEVCTPNIVVEDAPPPEKEVIPWPKEQLKEELKVIKCHFTSKCERARRAALTIAESKGKPLIIEPRKPEEPTKIVKWTNTGCEKAASYGANPEACPHPETPTDQDWFYTVNDAYLGQVCAKANPTDEDEKEVQAAMREYFDLKAWDKSFVAAWRQVLDKYGNWPLGGQEEPILINGKECKLFVLDKKCAEQQPGGAVSDVIDSALKCGGCGTFKLGSTCDECCKCQTGFGIDGIAQAGKALVEDLLGKDPLPTLPAGMCDFIPQLDNPLSPSPAPATTSTKTRKMTRRLH